MTTILFFQATGRVSWRRKLSGVLKAARENDWFVHVIERDATRAEVRRALETWRPIGCLVDRALSSSSAPDRVFGSIPLVYLDQNPRLPSRLHPALVHDSAAEARLAGGELLALGCRSYVYLSTGRNYFWDEERRHAFTELVGSAGYEAVAADAGNLAEVLASLPTPIGLLAANDHTAVDAYHAAAGLGLSIPGDLAIVGIDNDEMYCESVMPGITSAEPDFEGAGYRLARMLETEIAGGRHGRRAASETYGPLRLVRRGSTRAVTSAGARIERALEYIRCHACEPSIRVDDIAREMKCSRKLATLGFRRATGHSILDEIHEVRFRRICELLAGTDLPILDVIYASGYSSQSYPKKHFRIRTGLTMREWRNSGPGGNTCGRGRRKSSG